MQREGQPQKDPPEHHSPATKSEKSDAQNDQRYIEKAIQPNIEAVLYQIRSITPNGGSIVILRSAAKNPADVCPPAAVARRVRVALAIRVRMMDAVRRDPLNRSAFDRQRTANNQKVFDQFWDFVTSMRNQSMKSHPDAQAAGNPIENRGCN